MWCDQWLRYDTNDTCPLMTWSHTGQCPQCPPGPGHNRWKIGWQWCDTNYLTQSIHQRVPRLACLYNWVVLCRTTWYTLAQPNTMLFAKIWQQKQARNMWVWTLAGQIKPDIRQGDGLQQKLRCWLQWENVLGYYFVNQNWTRAIFNWNSFLTQKIFWIQYGKDSVLLPCFNIF